MAMTVADWPRQLWFGNEKLEELRGKELATVLREEKRGKEPENRADNQWRLGRNRILINQEGMGWATSNRKMYVPWNRRVVGVRILHHFTKHFLNLCGEYIFDEIHHCLYFHTVSFWVDQRNLLFALEFLTKMLSCGRTTSQGAGLMSQLNSQESVILSAICDLLTMRHE